MSHSSIGNMTNTQIETGSRHMQQCRTNYDVLVAMAGSEEELKNNDDKWCMGKDELVVSCNKHIDPTAALTATKYAYPSVVTTVGASDKMEKSMLACYYHFMGVYPSKSISKFCYGDASEITTKGQQYREFLPVGYSVGRACAHAGKGDTIASVQIGGLRTVLNGSFNVQTGDLIQMYIPDAEETLFHKNGGRKHFEHPPQLIARVNGADPEKPTEQETRRRDFHNRGQGVSAKGGAERIKTGVFSIKPYMESLNDEGHQYYGDKIRVFARAVSSARPFEPVDIMIARQSL